VLEPGDRIAVKNEQPSVTLRGEPSPHGPLAAMP
jgi:hypothetical protein